MPLFVVQAGFGGQVLPCIPLPHLRGIRVRDGYEEEKE